MARNRQRLASRTMLAASCAHTSLHCHTEVGQDFAEMRMLGEGAFGKAIVKAVLHASIEVRFALLCDSDR